MDYHPWTVKVGSFGPAWTNTEMWEVFILVLQQDLVIEKQYPSLIYLNQLRANAIIMNGIPRILPGGYIENLHSIYIPEEDVKITLKIKGVMSVFGTRIPT